MTSGLRVGFLGAGKMATALASGLAQAGLTEPADGVTLAGAAYGGVGVPACIASGRRAADAVLTRLQHHEHQLR